MGVFQTEVPVPAGSDSSRATVRGVTNGLQITVPLAMRPGYESMRAPSTFQPDHAAPGTGAEVKQTSAAPTSAERAGVAPSEGTTLGAGALAQRVVAPAPEELALAQGVEIVEEEYPWPQKRADASEGWWDNRGEFHSYGE